MFVFEAAIDLLSFIQLFPKDWKKRSETDILAELAWQIPGVYGSRITGGGFGGCTVSIVKNDAIDTFIDKVGTVYKEKTGHTAEFYVVDIGDGARPLN